MANYQDLLEEAGSRHGLPVGIMTALGGKESSFNPNAVSNKGAQGLTQVMPGTAKDMGYSSEQMKQPEYQADAGARYLAQMYQRYGDWKTALQAYHDGPGNVDKMLRGEYQPGPEGRQYVDDRFSQWTNDPATNNEVTQMGTSAKINMQEDPSNPFAQIESQAQSGDSSSLQDDPDNPFAQIETQSVKSSAEPQQVNSDSPSMLSNAEQAARGLVNIPFDILQGGASLINAGSRAVGGGDILDPVYRPVDRPTDPYAQAGETVGGYLIPGLGVAGNMAVGSLSEAGNQQGDFAENAAKNAALNLGAQGLLSGAAKAIGRGVTAVRGDISAADKQLLRSAEQNGVDVMTSDVVKPTTGIGRQLQQSGEQSLLGTGSRRGAQQEQRESLVSGMQQNLDREFGVYTPHGMQAEVSAGVQRAKDTHGKSIEDITGRMGDAPVDMSRSITAVEDAIQKTGQSLNPDRTTQDILIKLRDRLASGENFSTLRNLRTDLRESLQGDNLAMPSRADALYRRVNGAITADMNSAVGGTLGGDALNQLRQANNGYRQVARMVDNTGLKSALNKGDVTPELINNLVYSKRESDVRRLYGLLSEGGRDQLRAAYVGKALEAADGSPAKMLTQINKLRNRDGGGVFNTIFNQRQIKMLEGMRDVLEATQRASSANQVTQTGMALLNPARGGMALITGGQSVALEAAYGLASRVYESKSVRDAMLRLANSKAGTPAYELALSQAALMIRPVAANSSNRKY